MMEEIHQVSYELCGNELIALLFEASEIKRLWPEYNRIQKISVMNYGIFNYEDQAGYQRFSIGRIGKDRVPCLSFKSLAEAREFMGRKTEEFSLCPKLTGLQTSPGPCFDYKIRQCDGACAGKESARKYNRKVKKFLNSLSGSNDSVVIIGNGRSPGESSVVWIENGAYRGFGFFDSSVGADDFIALRSCITPYPDNQDIQRILQVYLRRDRQYRIIPIAENQAHLF
jgi:DNA polymerase-3 subunit epsilon